MTGHPKSDWGAIRVAGAGLREPAVFLMVCPKCGAAVPDRATAWGSDLPRRVHENWHARLEGDTGRSARTEAVIYRAALQEIAWRALTTKIKTIARNALREGARRS